MSMRSCICHSCIYTIHVYAIHVYAIHVSMPFHPSFIAHISPSWLLFNGQDPTEHNDLGDTNPSKVAEMMAVFNALDKVSLLMPNFTHTTSTGMMVRAEGLTDSSCCICYCCQSNL
jgi:hypothetical protein